MKLKILARERMPKIYKEIRHIKSIANGWIWRERKKSFGSDNPDKTFYVIRIRNKGIGLMAYYASILGSIKYAKSRGWYPVIDMQNYENCYLDQDKIGKENSWEYYFKQPQGVQLDEVYRSKNVILSYAYTSETGSPRRLYERLTGNNKTEFFEIAQNYMQFSDVMVTKIEDSYKKLFPQGKKVLGVSSRGTDMLNFMGHSKLPTREELLTYVETLMVRYGCEYVFVATEEAEVVDLYRNHFGLERVIVDERQRYDTFKDSSKQVLVDMSFGRENEKRLKGEEYLCTVALLSKCDCLVGALVGATLGAICMNGGTYSHIDIIDLGQY